ncbi:MAG: chemotaxis protein CheW [Gammaproteobacteria bacterium]|jgi:twitching motility protein PilI
MSKSEALAILSEIQAATFQNAAQLPLKESAQPEWQGIGYQIGGIRLVSPMGEVNEILKVPKITPLPGVKSWISGIANVRGRLMPIVDLHEYLSMTPTLPMVQWRVLIVEDEDLVAGLVVEQSLGIQHFLEGSYEEASGEGLETIRPYVKGAFRHGGRVFFEMDLKSILRDERFFDVAEKSGPR